MSMKTTSILPEKLAEWSSKYPNKTCLVEAATGRSLSYRELNLAVGAVCVRLGQDRTIMACLSGGISSSVLWLASLVNGDCLVPLSPALTDHELTRAYNMHQPDLIVSDHEHSSYPADKVISTEALEELIFHPCSDTVNALPSGEGTIVLSTSGSTGKPKSVVLSARQIIHAARSIISSHQLSGQDRCLTPLPMYHVNAPVVALMTTMLTGGQLITAPKYRTSEFWNWIKKYDPTWVSLVPTMIAMLLRTDRPDFLDQASLRYIRTASAPLPVTLIERFEAKFGLPLVETYGLSEAASTVAANPVPPDIHKPGSVGLPIGVEIGIFSPKDLQPLARFAVGEVCVRGDSVISAYVGNVGRQSFFEGWFRTGDLGYIDDEGYVFLTGRIKDIIIRGGENIFPREIEEAIISHPSVQEVAVVGHPDPIYGEKIVAIVVPDGEAEGLSDSLRQYVSRLLSPTKVPVEFHIVSELPKTPSNKVNKTLLREPSVVAGISN
jgi:acyl-CoA synthetase (AMP-forming)/AMP-acid ligase II